MSSPHFKAILVTIVAPKTDKGLFEIQKYRDLFKGPITTNDQIYQVSIKTELDDLVFDNHLFPPEEYEALNGLTFIIQRVLIRS